MTGCRYIQHCVGTNTRFRELEQEFLCSCCAGCKGAMGRDPVKGKHTRGTCGHAPCEPEEGDTARQTYNEEVPLTRTQLPRVAL